MAKAKAAKAAPAAPAMRRFVHTRTGAVRLSESFLGYPYREEAAKATKAEPVEPATEEAE